jgi:hypothetical protein
MRAAILAGGPYGACENEAFLQVSLRPLARFSHCAHRAPARTTKPKKKFKFLANEKYPKHEKIYQSSYCVPCAYNWPSSWYLSGMKGNMKRIME